MRYYLIIHLIIVLSVNTYSQCNYTNTTFSSGEEVNYNVYYHLGFMWFNAAEVNFKVEPTVYKNSKAFRFISKGQTKPNYAWIYKVRDRYESIADSVTLNSLYFLRNTNEGNFSVNNSYKFNYSDSLIFSKIENSETQLYYDTIKMCSCTFDVLTAVYACRNINYSTLSYSDTIPLNMVVDNKIYNLYLRYIGIENAQIDDGTEFRCRKFKILMVKGSIFSGGEDIILWITDDKAKVPICVEAKILVGSIIARVKSIKGNKWQLTSKTIVH